MKTMTCRQLGGACDKAFHANSFEEMTEISKKHGMEMFNQKDSEHLLAMEKINNLMKDKAEMESWFAQKREEFNSLPHDSTI